MVRTGKNGKKKKILSLSLLLKIMSESDFSHVLNNNHQRLLYYTLSTAAEQEFLIYRRFLYVLVGFFVVGLCYGVYWWNYRQLPTLPEANPELGLKEARVLESMREKMEILRKESWETPADGKQLPATIMVKGSSGYQPPSILRMEHDNSQRREHRKQRRVSFASP
jgi:hypothetical protein